MNIVCRYTIQVQVGGKPGPVASPRLLRPDREECQAVEPPSSRHPSPQNGDATKSSRRADIRNIDSRSTTRNPPIHHQPPPPYSVDPPKSDGAPRPESIMQLYEEIMLSDSETIKVQQETLDSQQDIVRSQAHIIKQMRDILESQDAHILQLEETIAGLRERVRD
ncbi:hypothetical protein NX059_010446 [Plenodomus lindquistii]|nr:hypothetical protein NX059_010446 [Plenodomus lindquistii]